MAEKGADGTTAESASPGKEPKPAEGLSQFIGKVLDQLSLSAWLPAAMLVGCGALLLQLRSQGNFDFGAAIIGLTAKPLGILVVLLFALVLATLVSQAFSFSAIRFLEGYWKGPLVRLGVYRIMVRRKVRKHAKLESHLKRQKRKVFEAARDRMEALGVERALIRLVEDHVDPENRAEPLSQEDRETVAAIEWRRFCPPDVLERESRMVQAHQDYPSPHRIMPTGLGNILRATEEEITADGQETQQLVLRRGDSIPARLRQHHDQFRTRLDMYCTLVFVQLGLAGLTVALLVPARNPLPGTLLVTAAFTALAVTSYSAAIASARGYCDTLKVIFSGESPRASS